jgi:hypothetical protein
VNTYAHRHRLGAAEDGMRDMPQRDGIEVADRASGGFSSERISLFLNQRLQQHARYRRIQDVISELPRPHATAILAGFVRW